MIIYLEKRARNSPRLYEDDTANIAPKRLRLENSNSTLSIVEPSLTSTFVQSSTLEDDPSSDEFYDSHQYNTSHFITTDIPSAISILSESELWQPDHMERFSALVTTLGKNARKWKTIRAQAQVLHAGYNLVTDANFRQRVHRYMKYLIHI